MRMESNLSGVRDFIFEYEFDTVVEDLEAACLVGVRSVISVDRHTARDDTRRRDPQVLSVSTNKCKTTVV